MAGGGTSSGDQAAGTSHAAAPHPHSEVSWAVRMLGHIISTLAACAMMLLALFTMLSFSGMCILSGVIMIVLGLVVLVVEAPLFFQYFSLAAKFTEWVERRPYFLRAAIYIILSIVPFVMCIEMTTLFGCGALFVAGVFYGVIAVGKKGDAVKAAHSGRANGSSADPEAGRSSTFNESATLVK